MHPSSATPKSRVPSVLDKRNSTEVLVPCLNFAIVTPGIYRSGHPNSWNESFLDDLHLKSIMYLATDDYRSFTSNWAKSRDITIFHHRMESVKDKYSQATCDMMALALSQALDTRNHPILIHCNKGKNRVGLLVCLIRRFQRWSLTSIFNEYSRFYGAGKEARQTDNEFVETFDISAVVLYHETKPHWLTL